MALKIEKKYPELTGSPILRSKEQIAVYVESRSKGEPHRFAEMCALQQPPGSKGTDRAFTQGAWRQMEGMNERNRREILSIASKAGISTQGKCYKGGLGRYDDPAAWVSTADDVLAVARKKNLTISGAVNHKGVESLAPKRVRLDPAVVGRLVDRKLKADPSLAAKVRKSPKKLRDIQHQVVEQHSKKR